MHDRYAQDVLAGDWRRNRRRQLREVVVEPDLVLEERGTGYCGAVVAIGSGEFRLQDRHGRERIFSYGPGYLVDGEPVVVTAPVATTSTAPTRSRSGSVRVEGLRARTAQGSRILVEGLHDAELIERVWGHDLRVAGTVVQPLDGADNLADVVRTFGPTPQCRLGILLDHLVPGSKESRIAEQARRVADEDSLLVVGHPFVDVWQGVRPAVLGLESWPTVPRGQDWKTGVLAAIGWRVEPWQAWRRILDRVESLRDLEPALAGRVEELVDFVTAPEMEALHGR